MALELNRYRVDQKKVNDGAWIQIDEEAKILVARMNNPAYTEEMSRLRAPYKQLIKKGELETSAAEEMLNACMAKTILLGWEGLHIGGKLYKYSLANCEKLLKNPEYKEFRDLVLALSNDNDQFRQEEVEELGKD